MKKIRTLLPEDIELRAADKNTKGDVHMLMYITSRSATKLLDETYCAENYNIEYVDVAGQIYCKLSVWDEEHQRYVVRMDTGEEAKISQDKSLASDALKRVIVRLGVTELYSGPSIYLPDDNYGNKGYKVSEISYDENRNITHLVIVNRFNREAFRWDANAPTSTTYQPTAMTPTQTYDHLAEWKQYCSKKVETGQASKEDTRAIYESGKEEASNCRYKDFFASSLWKRLARDIAPSLAS